MTDASYTLADHKRFASSIGGGAAIAYHYAKSHETRRQALERLLEYPYNALVIDRNLNKGHSEDAMTAQIVRQLTSFGVDAEHDGWNGGHCDIIVKAVDHFIWIAEAKIYKGNGWTKKGFLQLAQRFGVAGYGRSHCELLIYCRNRLASGVLKKWMDNLTQDFQSVEIVEDETETLLHFRSRHMCQTSGLNFYIRHKIIPLHWDPS